MTDKIIYGELTYKINGILFSVHNKLGRYCNEKQYSDKIEHELKNSGLIFVREKELPKSFEAEKSGRNRVDFLIENIIVLEIKCKRILDNQDFYQTMRYLSALNIKLGILANFRPKYLKFKRILNPNAKE